MRSSVIATTVAVFVLGLVLLATIPGWAGTTTLGPDVDRYDITSSIEILEDPGRAWSIDDVTGDHASSFAPQGSDAISKGLTDSAFWIRFALKNDTAEPQRRLVEVGRATLDDVDFHGPSGVQHTDRYLPFSERPFAYRNPVFRLTLPPHSSTTIHLRVWSESEVWFPVRVWTEDGLRNHERDEHALLSLFYGAHLILAIYHLVLFIRIREMHLLYFATYVPMWGAWLCLVDGVPYGFVPGLSALRGIPFLLLGWGSIAIAGLFSQSFLETKTKAPRMHRLLGALAAGAALIGTMSATGLLSWRTNNAFAFIMFLTFYPSLLAAGLVVWRAGSSEAMWFCFAFGVWVINGVLSALLFAGYLDVAIPDILNPLRWGVLVEVILMSVALAMRIERLGNERAEAQAIALAQGQLAEAERSAALGRLMAGILHEVNSPLGALRSAADTLGKTFTRVAKHAGENKKAARALQAGHELTVSVEQSSARIGEVVNSLKRFVAVDEAERKRVDLREGLEGALTLLSTNLDDTTTIERDIPDESVMAECAPAQLNHALLELMQHAAHRGRTVSVTLDEDALITITDDGERLTDSELATLFDVGFDRRGDQVRMSMALPLAKQSIEQMGGRIDVESSDERTVYRIALGSTPGFSQQRQTPP